MKDGRNKSPAQLDSEARKSAMLAVSLDAIVSMDGDGLVMEWNPAAERMFGYSAAEAVGKPMAYLIIPERLRQAHWASLARYLTTGEGPVLGKRIEMPAIRKGGSEFPVELAITRVPVSGAVLFMGVLRDISDRKRAEAEIKEREQMILELSTPVLRLGPRLLLFPIIGLVTPERAGKLEQSLLRATAQYRARVVIVDLTGVAALNGMVAQGLVDSLEACRLLGASVVVTGLTPLSTAALNGLGSDTSALIIKGDLQSGVEEAGRILASVGKAAARRGDAWRERPNQPPGGRLPGP